MSTTFTLSIPEPCHEDWNKMTPKDKGRFCDSCEKVVVDFTAKSDVTIANHLRDHKNVCGRFNASQLDRPITLANRKYSLLPPIAASFILPLALLATTNAYSQGKPKSTNFTSNNYVSLNIGSHSMQITKKVKGQILTVDGLPLPGVRVSEQGTNNQTQTDFDGYYRLEVTQDAILHVSYIGFYSEQIELKGTNDIYNVILSDCINCLEEVIIVGQGIRRVPVAINGYTQSRVITSKEATEKIIQPEILGDTIQFVKPLIKEQVKIKDTIAVEQDLTTIKKIIGNVLDDLGYPLPGVAVMIKGSAVGTTTDYDGNYTINVVEGQKLTFNYVGYDSQEILINENTTVVKISMISAKEIEQLIGFAGAVTVVYSETIEHEALIIKPSRKIPKEELQLRYKNAAAFKKLQQEKKKQAKRKAKAAQKKRK